MTVDDHYENFPVASVLVPRAIRPFVVAIYRFARHADDVADEGDASADQRLATLAALDEDVVRLFAGGEARAPTVRGLSIIREAGYDAITEQPFRNLLDAFRQDLTVRSYESNDQLLDYCRRSANPVGRLMLALVGVSDQRALAASDNICSALQLINFWQDASIDASRGRIYVPASEFVKHRVSSDEFPDYPTHRSLMQALCESARALLLSGSPLLTHLSGRFKLEIAFTIAGGLRVLDKIGANDWNVSRRPTLRWYDSLPITCHAVRVWFRDSRQRAT